MPPSSCACPEGTSHSAQREMTAAASRWMCRRRATSALRPERVAPDVGDELLIAGVRAKLEVDELSLAVIEGSRGEEFSRRHLLRDLLVGVAVARIGNGVLLEERLRRVGGVV